MDYSMELSYSSWSLVVNTYRVKLSTQKCLLQSYRCFLQSFDQRFSNTVALYLSSRFHSYLAFTIPVPQKPFQSYIPLRTFPSLKVFVCCDVCLVMIRCPHFHEFHITLKRCETYECGKCFLCMFRACFDIEDLVWAVCHCYLCGDLPNVTSPTNLFYQGCVKKKRRLFVSALFLSLHDIP